MKGHQVIADIYLTKQSEKNKSTTLKLSSNTCWDGVVIMFDSLLEGMDSLQEIPISQSADRDSPIKRILLDDIFWERVVSSMKLLKPIAVASARIEGDNDILSDVQTLLADVREEIRTALPTSLLLQAEETAVLKYIKKHEDFCLKPIHAAAYMLDPKYAGKRILSGAEINKVYGVIPTMSHHLVEGKVLGGLVKYNSKQGLWDGDAIWQSCQRISSATWWKGLETPSPVASIILQIPPTSAASEHNWSLFANTHTKARNRLTNTKWKVTVKMRPQSLMVMRWTLRSREKT